MRNPRRFAWMLLVLLFALTVAACGGGDDGATDPDDASAGDTGTDGDGSVADADDGGGDAGGADGPEGEPIVIGGTLGLTGAFAEPSAGYLAAYEYWEERVNSQGGLLGRPVELQIYDDESTPSTAQDLYQRLVDEDDVDLLLAPYTTFVGGAIIPVAERNDMVLWNGGFVGIELFKRSDWIVGAYTYQEPEYTTGIFEMLEAMPEDERPTRIGIATAQNPFTLVVRDGFETYQGIYEKAEALGMEIVLDEEYAGDAQEVSGIIEEAIDQDVEVFFALSLPNDAVLFARTAEEKGFSPDIYCTCGSQMTTVPAWKDLGSSGEGIMGTALAWPTDEYPEIDNLFDTLENKFGWEELPAYATTALGILQVLEQSVEGVGSLDQAALRDHVTNASFETALGTMQYDEDRVPAYNAIVMQFLDGKNEVVWPPERATADPVIPMPMP